MKTGFSRIAEFKNALFALTVGLLVGCAQPHGVGQEKVSLLSVDPVSDINLSVHPVVTGRDRADLQVVLDQTKAVMRSPEFLENARSLNSAYPTIFMRKGWAAWSISDVAAAIQNPTNGIRYAATPVWIKPRDGGATTGSNVGPNREWAMSINSSPLANWRADDTVQKSCAINTLSHEVMHTMLDSQGWMISIDGGRAAKSSRRSGTTASYVVGQLAQCTWLQKEGRISSDEIAMCMPVFYYQKKPNSVGKFAVDRCDDFPAGTPVKL
ncbi:hypothetical protein ACFCW2_02260 [Qipengyuania sp. DSG2-2]|uniref:hypothetical protein n=1 Tax=Qipengyuania sp. DGS2-2 TaxID=3349631 RepID=UPI0036D39C69